MCSFDLKDDEEEEEEEEKEEDEDEDEEETGGIEGNNPLNSVGLSGAHGLRYARLIPSEITGRSDEGCF